MASSLAQATEPLDTWADLSPSERLQCFRTLSPIGANDLFVALSTRDQAELILLLHGAERRVWVRVLPPDELADLMQCVSPEERERLLFELDESARREVIALLAYAEDAAGGLMSPRYARLRP